MSSINFRSKSASARVSGAERAAAGVITQNLMMAVLDMVIDQHQPEKSILFKALPSDCYAVDRPKLMRDWWRMSSMMGYNIVIDGKEIDMFSVSLNTAFAIGSDPIKLLARLHGQCEIHCYVEDASKLWLSNIIRDGLSKKIMRPEMGWEGVISLLESSDGLIVTDFSVSDSFPNPHVAGWEPPLDEKGDPNYEAWYEIDADERWEKSALGIRSQKGLEITPVNWTNFYFNDGVSAFGLIEMCSGI